jgi:hypothetical protein
MVININNVLLHNEKDLEKDLTNTLTHFMNYVVSNRNFSKFLIGELALAAKFDIEKPEIIKYLVDNFFNVEEKWLLNDVLFIDTAVTNEKMKETNEKLEKKEKENEELRKKLERLEKLENVKIPLILTINEFGTSEEIILERQLNESLNILFNSIKQITEDNNKTFIINSKVDILERNFITELSNNNSVFLFKITNQDNTTVDINYILKQPLNIDQKRFFSSLFPLILKDLKEQTGKNIALDNNFFDSNNKNIQEKNKIVKTKSKKDNEKSLNNDFNK